MPMLTLENVSFSYPVYGLTNRSIKVTLARQMAGGRIAASHRAVSVRAINDLSFSLRPGDRLGLVGHNGSGKSTLLRLLAGLARPTSGRIVVDGRIIALIDKGLGIHPELSGYQNIELPLRLLGATDAEVKAAREEIPEWTGLGDFLNLPVRTYSEGMKARLLFAVCTALHGDILVMDEWLGAGDATFAARAAERIHRFLERTAILVLATHSPDLMRAFCNRVIWLDRGEMVAFGDTETVLQMYHASMHSAVAAE
jgi:ABC-type polysaccharide/polyol phosphate transport system ATPase subunit